VNGDELHAVTGAFGFTGRYITRRLIESGVRVVTLTTKPAAASPFGARVAVRPLDFGDPDRLVESLRGARVLYNTYWVRFAWGEEPPRARDQGTRPVACDPSPRRRLRTGRCA